MTNILSATLIIFTINLSTVGSKFAVAKYFSRARHKVFAILKPMYSIRIAPINFGIKLTQKPISIS
jgi:hypothetical protein